MAQMQVAINAASEWSAGKMKLNSLKCETCLFTSDTREASWALQIDLDGQRLRVNPTPKFLGWSWIVDSPSRDT